MIRNPHTGDCSCIRTSGTHQPLQNKFLAASLPDHWHPGPHPASSQPLPSDCGHSLPSVRAWVGEGQGCTSQCLGARQGGQQLTQSWAGTATAHVEGHLVGTAFPPVQVPRASQVQVTIPSKPPFWGGLQRWAHGKGPVLLPWTP